MSAEIGSDEVWLEVICLANLEIAGSPRNIFRYSLKCLIVGVEHWMDSSRAIRKVQSNSEYYYFIAWESVRSG